VLRYAASVYPAIFAAITRHRRPVLVATVVTAATVLALIALSPPEGIARHALPVVPVLLVFPCGFLALIATAQPRPATFVVDSRTPAFRTPPQAAPVCRAAATIFMVCFFAAQMLGSWSILNQGPTPTYLRLLGIAIAVLTCAAVAVCAMTVVAAWRGDDGVQLRPGGLIDHSSLGTLTVPWEALAPGYPLPVRPKAGSLALTYTAPELVQRRGLASRRFIRTDNIDALFLVHAIRHYLAHPQRRSALGTQTEYDHLLRALTESTAMDHGASERRQRFAPPANENH
jgi:hypothetical protein